MTTKTEIAGFVIQDKEGYAIYGTGATEDAAWADVVADTRVFFDKNGDHISADEARVSRYVSYPATAALIDCVRENGGAIAWAVVDGVAHAINEDNLVED